jgi:four helix bundle protein
MNHETSKLQNQSTSGRSYNCRNLKVWQEAQQIAVEVFQLAERLPKTPAVTTVVRQLVASAGSVSANIAEGHGRFTFGAYKNHLSIAKGSACETDNWIDLLRRTGHVSPEVEQSLHSQIFALLALLTYKIRQLEARQKGTQDSAGRIGESPFEYGTESDFRPEDSRDD